MIDFGITLLRFEKKHPIECQAIRADQKKKDADIARSIDSKRGNEEMIAQAIEEQE